MSDPDSPSETPRNAPTENGITTRRTTEKKGARRLNGLAVCPHRVGCPCFSCSGPQKWRAA